MIAEKHKKIAKIALLCGFCAGLWGAFLEAITEASGSHLLPQLLNIAVMTGIGLYAVATMQKKITALEHENRHLKDEIKSRKS